MSFEITVLPATRCPHCGYVITAHSDLESADIPGAGDLTICARCSAVLVYTPTLTLRALLEWEELALSPATRADIRTQRQRARQFRQWKGGDLS